jgi:hypothetical protein
LSKSDILRWLIAYLFFKFFVFFFAENEFTYVSGILIWKILGKSDNFFFDFSLPALYFGIITIQVICLLFFHALLFWSIVGTRKILEYIIFVFILSVGEFILYLKFDYLTNSPGFFNLFFYIFTLTKFLIVKVGIVPFFLLFKKT